MGGEGDLPGIEQDVLIRPYEQMIYTQPRIRPRKWDAQTSLRFWDTNGSLNLSQVTRSSDSQQKNSRIVGFVVPAHLRVKLKESKKREKKFDLARELKNYGTWKWRWYQLYRYGHQRIDTGTSGFGNKRTSGNNQNYSIVDYGQNTKKSPGDFRRLAITQTPVESHQRILVWKTLKRKNLIYTNV